MIIAQSLTYTRDKLAGETTEQDVLAAAEAILRSKLERHRNIGTPTDASDFLRMRLGTFLHEEFHVLWLDNRHRILDQRQCGDPAPQPSQWCGRTQCSRSSA